MRLQALKNWKYTPKIFALIALVGVAGLVGWVWNIVKVFHADALGFQEILRITGIFLAPLGAVLGYF